MLKNTITLAKLTETKIFCKVSNYFGLYKSLTECENTGFKPVFIPEFIDLMLCSNEKSDIWNSWHKWVTPSAKIAGKSKKGNEIVIYAHVPHFFSNIENFSGKPTHELYKIFLERETPQSEIEKLLELEDNENVFVHDYSDKQQEGEFELGEALEKTRFASLVGGRNRAEKFLEKIKGRVRTLKINDSDVFCKPKPNTSRQYANTHLIELSPPRKIYSWNDFGFTYFLGVKDKYPVLDKAILDFNSVFEQVSKISEDHVSEFGKEVFLNKLKSLILG